MPEVDPLTGLPKPPPAPWLGSQGTEDPSMANAVTKLAAKDSAINRMAATEGLKAANRRGLLNSSMAVTAAQDSVLKNIMPIAQQDAQAAAARNAAARAFEYGMTAQDDTQGFMTGERVGTQQHETAEAKALREWQTAEAQAGRVWSTGERIGSQTFASTQAELDRVLQDRLQTKQLSAADIQQIRAISSTEGIEAANRALQTALQKSQQVFAGTQADLDRILQERMQTRQLSASDVQQIRQIGSVEGIEAANRALQTALQKTQLTFASTQADLDRVLQERMQGKQISAADAQQLRQIASTEGMEAASRALQERLQVGQQQFLKGERIGTQEFATTQANLDRDLTKLLQNNEITAEQKNLLTQIGASRDINDVNNALQLLLQKNQQGFETAERIGTQQFQLTEQGIQNELTKLLQNNEITAAQAQQIAQIKSTEGINAANNKLQTELQKNDQVWSTTERLGQEKFISTQADLDRDLESLMQQNAITSAEKTEAARILSAEGINAANNYVQMQLQKNDLTYQSTRDVLDRALELKMQDNQITATEQNLLKQIESTEGMESAKNTLQLLLQKNDQRFATTQADLDRRLELQLQGNEISAERAAQLRQIASTEGIEKAGRELELDLQQKQNAWQTTERLGTQKFVTTQAELDRKLETLLAGNQITSDEVMQARQIAATQGIEKANRDLQIRLQDDQQAWTSGERLGSQTFQALENQKNRTHAVTQASLDRALELTLQSKAITSEEKMQIKQLAATKDLNTADNALTKLLAEKDIAFRMAEGKLDRNAALAMQNDMQAFNAQQNAAGRALETSIAKMNLSATQQQNLSQAASNTMGWYQQQYATIMNNPDLSSSQRTTYLKNAKDLYTSTMKLNQTLFKVKLGF